MAKIHSNQKNEQQRVGMCSKRPHPRVKIKIDLDQYIGLKLTLDPNKTELILAS
jgi:hypothetical protein